MLRNIITRFFAKKPQKRNIRTTVVGSCLSNFVVSDYLLPALGPDIEIARLSSALQLRSDIILELIQKKGMDMKLVEHYLNQGRWGSNQDKQEYALWFSTFIKNKIEDSRCVSEDIPDLLVMDSLCDIRHSLYVHKSEGWRAFFGNIRFDEETTTNEFKQLFQHIGLLTPAQQIENIREITHYFQKKNPTIKTVYMHFPLHPEYVEQKWIERSESFSRQLEAAISSRYLINFFPISLPTEMNRPVTDPEHPNYSPQVWNHFYPEVYKYFAEQIATHLNQ